MVAFAGILSKRDTALARRWQARTAAVADEGRQAEARAFQQAMRIDPGRGRVVLARALGPDGVPFWAGLSTERLLSMHGWLCGATGSGKSYLALGCLLQVLQGREHPVIVLDSKGELTRLVLEVVVPALVASPGGAEMLDHLRIIRPFDRQYLPMLRVTEPEIGIAREIQAFNLAAALEEALASDLGARMNRAFLRLTTLAIERREPLTVIRSWLANPERFTRDARSSSDPSTREYAQGAFLREQRTTMDALLARCDAFFFLRETQLALGAPTCVSFKQCLDRGLTLIDLGDPPAGAERVARFWGAVIVGQLARAILSRPVDDRSPQAWVVLEEFQEVLARHQAEQFGRLLALARFKKVGLLFINQQPGQVSAIDTGLTKSLRTNTGFDFMFRSSVEDARSFAHALPVSPEERANREVLVEEITRLPTREYYLWLKPFRAQRVRSPRLALDALRRRGADIPVEVRERIGRGTVAASRDELERIAKFDERDRQCREPAAFLVPNADPKDSAALRLG